MKGIILHGGHGTRLRPLTHTGPKQLLSIANKPMSQYALDDMIDAGINEIAIIIGDIFPNKVKEFYGDGSKFGIKITYIYQDRPRGIAHAVGLCRNFIGNDKFVVYLGDNILKGGIKRFADRFIQTDADSMILLCEVKDPSRFGIAYIKENTVERIVEKPKDSDSNLAVIGIYFLTPNIFHIIDKLKPSWRGELEITDALHNLVITGAKIQYDFVTAWWKDTGTPEDILEANRFILDSIVTEVTAISQLAPSLQGRVIIGKDTIISSESLVRGPVIIGSSCTIEKGVFIGPYTSIGDNVIIKKGEIENSIILNNCIVDTNDRILDSIIGNDTKITNNDKFPQKGIRFVLGDSSIIQL